MNAETWRPLFRYFLSTKKRICKSIGSASDLMMNAASVVVGSRIFTGTHLSAFDAVTVDEVVKLINSLSNKSSPLDILPTSLLKSCCDIFAPLIAHLANRSFESGSFPALFKTAQVLPLLKKPGLDRSHPPNYRPISNLNTISKIIERLVLGRLKKHVDTTGNLNPLQSAYRVGHSTETALLHVLDRTYTAIDEKKLTALIALDISCLLYTSP